ncbi:MAG: hypothetical protein J6Y98_03615 [Bacteroidales bacterium]|nr:hypothetical protein [Bacteroidales bacterium]
MKRKFYILIAMLLMTSAATVAQNKDIADIDKHNTQVCMNTLSSWSEAMNKRDEAKLNELYSDIVLYYKAHYNKEQVARSRNRLFKINKFYEQRCENVKVEYINSCQAKLTFDKYVKTAKEGDEKKYQAYLQFIINDDTAFIVAESDVTTDARMEKKAKLLTGVDNNTKLDAIFCDANIGKTLRARYWDLVDMGNKKDGPLAKMILSSGLPRGGIDGIIIKDYGGKKGTYACGGYVSAGECFWYVIFLYDPATKTFSCIGSDE